VVALGVTLALPPRPTVGGLQEVLEAHKVALDDYLKVGGAPLPLLVPTAVVSFSALACRVLCLTLARAASRP
jgi:hypothetical protein